MTYSKSLQGRFVATGYPAVGVLFVSAFLWILGAVLGDGECGTLSSLVVRSLSLAAYCGVALLLGGLYLFERRVHYLPAVFLWLTALFPFMQTAWLPALSLLLLVLAVARLFACGGECGHERTLFGAFALLSLAMFLCVQSAFLLPLFVAYMFISRATGARNFVAALLGVLAPFWLLGGVVWLFPSFEVIFLPLKASIEALDAFPASPTPTVFYALLAVEVLVWAVALYIYIALSYPAKQLLRRRLLFVLLLNLFMMLLSLVFAGDSLLFLVWRAPWVAVLASYAFSLKVTRLTNFYFVSLNAAWLLIAFICLWIG